MNDTNDHQISDTMQNCRATAWRLQAAPCGGPSSEKVATTKMKCMQNALIETNLRPKKKRQR
jgi:hypothetical protein